MSSSETVKTVDLAKAIAAGTVIGGKYRIDSLIAEGGMAFVYSARDSSLDERVAIKVLKLEFRQQKDVLARFVREAKTTRRIQSDHCVKVHEVGLDQDHGPFMVMEFLEGTNLRDLLEAGGKVVPRRACEIVIQVCDGLAAAHTIDCVHRDIKPDNIVILRRGELEVVRVLDFGISKHSLTGSVLDQDLSLVSTIKLMGTPLYMSPEQMRTSSTIDARTDIWAVGAMLYEMLTGRPPFVSDSITELCSMIISDEPTPIAELEPSVPADLARAIHKCLLKKPDDRYQNVGELALALLPFAPRRSRAFVERILSTLSAAGVQVDRSEVSNYPPASTDTGPLNIPGPPQVPRTSGVQIVGAQPVAVTAVMTPAPMTPSARTPSPATPASTPEKEMTEKESAKKPVGLLIVVAAGLLLLIGLTAMQLLSRGAHEATPTGRPSAPSAPETAAAPPSTPVTAPAAVAPPASAEPAASVRADRSPAPTPAPKAAARPIEPKAPTIATKPPSATAPATTSAVPAPTVSSKVKILGDEPSRPKVLD